LAFRFVLGGFFHFAPPLPFAISSKIAFTVGKWNAYLPFDFTAGILPAAACSMSQLLSTLHSLDIVLGGSNFSS
jgi:hypothetical protein